MGQFHNTVVSVFLLCIFCNCARSLKYDDLASMGITCSVRDTCSGYKETSFSQRNCECDSSCHKYQDCCIDVRRRPSTRPASNVMCLNYGQDRHSGIYVVSKCSTYWKGPNEVKENCEGTLDLSDPIIASPVASESERVTYKNLYCAECNNADMNTLKVFQSKLSCGDVQGVSQDGLMDQLSFNKEKNAWGVNRLDDEGNTVFKECKIIFDLPSYLNDNVRFCRANIISTCARGWTRPQVKKSCEEYMAVVYTKSKGAYKNPHCAKCNNIPTAQLLCQPDESGIKKNLSFDKLVDINEESNNDTNKCPGKQFYDPFFKKCRNLKCIIPGYVLSNGKCVRGG